ncbi:MAG TPA: hypothetical protein VGC99_12725, partial [Candidatus Tectomicrobia bacterium]
GAGFYNYQAGGVQPNFAAMELLRLDGNEHPEPAEVWRRPVFMMLHEAAFCLAEGVIADWAEADRGANLGLDFPANKGGLLAYLNEVSPPALTQSLLEWQNRYGERFRPSWQGRIPSATSYDEARNAIHN